MMMEMDGVQKQVGSSHSLKINDMERDSLFDRSSLAF